MGASNFNQLLNGVWGPRGVLESCIMLLAGAKLDAVSGKVGREAAVSQSYWKMRWCWLLSFRVAQLKWPPWLLLVTHPLLASSWWEAGLTANVKMGEHWHRKTLVHILGFSS